jgi:hypothetical protein
MTKSKTKKNVVRQMKKGTLDQKHTEKLNKFEKMNNSLPHKKAKLKTMEKELEAYKKINPKKYTSENIHRKTQLIESIEKLKNEIKSIENCTEPLNYLVKTLPILVDYYDNENVIDDDMEEYVELSDNGKTNILSYFVKEKVNQNISDKKPNTESNKNNASKKRISKAKLYDSYLNATDRHYKKKTQNTDNVCKSCGGEKILSQNDGFIVCSVCGLSETVLLVADKPNYKEPTQDTGTYAYKRINHLTEILSQLQAKESTDIPQKVFDSIKTELKKRSINKNSLEIFGLRRILKRLNYRKYYEHVAHILQIINGREPPNFSRNDEIKIKKMFRDIQKPFAIYCPKNRKNFLNYSYVLHKFCELLGLNQYISYFPLLKNNAKLLQHDKIWKNICKYMNWEYHKSI